MHICARRFQAVSDALLEAKQGLSAAEDPLHSSENNEQFLLVQFCLR